MMAATGLACNAPSATPSSERAATGSRLPPVTLSLAQVSDAGVRAVDTPAPEGSVFGDLHSDPHGALVLSWVEPAERGGAVRFASRSDDGAWSEVRTAVTDAAMPVMWADPPRVFTFADDAVIVTWEFEDIGVAIPVRITMRNGGDCPFVGGSKFRRFSLPATAN